jgi:ABC-type Fe3+ transport system permease subunit
MTGILIEYVPAVRRTLGILSIALAIAVGSLGIFELAAEDNQGGRHLARAMILGVAVSPAVAAAALLRLRRRRV